ncbi:hypothetical protein MTO96_007324 [Rhipicephalus appendiculatus]
MNLETPSQDEAGRAKNGKSEQLDLHLSDKNEALMQPLDSSGVTLEWKDITFTVKGNNRKKTLLNRLYGQANPGTLTAIMGPSGAGKTTLLNILSGHYDKGYKGEVQVNGYVREAKLFNMQSCYVMQDDCLLGYLTARETLAMSVELRTSTCERRKISEIVEDALDLWGLQGCANTLARSLSGGEKKRLVIAQELMSDVPVVFLDEPTSGLDSCSALRCVQVLRTLADNGRTVLCSLHNPNASVFSHFDMLYMLSDGMCIYGGPTERLVPFLNSLNLQCPDFKSPSDFHHPVSKEKTLGDQSMVTIYGGRLMTREESYNQRRQHEVHAKGAKALQLFTTLMKRFLYCHMRDKFTSVARLVASLYFAVLLSVTYYCSGNRAERVRDTVAMHFATMVILLFQSVTPILLTFPLEIKVLLKEQRNCCYSPSTYFIARIISELPFTIGCTLFIMTIVHWATCQPVEFGRIAIVVLFAIAYCSACESIGYVMSTVFSLQTVVFVASPLCSPLIVLSGFYVKPQHLLPVIAWIPSASHMYYAHRAIIFALYGGGRGELECDDSTDAGICIPVDGNYVLEVMDVSDVNLFVYFGAVVAIDIFWNDKGYKGEVQVNGYVREAKLFNMQSCYVMQDDCLLGYLTARETLAMSVELRKSTRGRRKISEIVEDTLDLWGLQGCADTLARSLSGGEKKRLVIAQELMSDVPVVFLDEPTSGLDSCSALRCVQALRTLADNGRTVLCSLHNPSASVFSQFDRIGCVVFLMTIVHWTTGQPMEFYRVAVVVTFTIAYCSSCESIGYVASTLLSLETVVFIASPLCSPFLVFSGVFVHPQHLLPVVAWLPSVSNMFHTHRAIMFALYGGGRGELECDDSTDAGICIPVDGNYVLDTMDASDLNLFVKFGALLAIDVCLKLTALCRNISRSSRRTEKGESVDLRVRDKDETLLQPGHSSAVKLEWKNITFTVQEKNGKKTLLNHLYGQANPGTMTAIMGPSGAGKSTLLNVLSGHYDRGYEGEVQVNGYVREAKLFNMQSCYVMQDDCLLGYLTARETLAMSVELRTSTRGRRKISEIVEDALDLWGLQGCANTLARSLSGGERKRLAIAQELMSDVPVVFLDEPTSGLDSCSALRCVQALRTLADSGRTVLCSLHNPSASVFSQFDTLYMLSDGMCIYSGRTERLVPFLNSLNLHCPALSSPSDFITDVAAGVHGELTVKLSSFFIPEDNHVSKEKEQHNQSRLTIYGGRLMTHKERDNEIRQYEVNAKALQLFMTLIKRFWCCHIRDKFTSVSRVGASLYFALLMSVTYYNSGNRTERIRDTVTMYFAIMIILMYQSITPIVLTYGGLHGVAVVLTVLLVQRPFRPSTAPAPGGRVAPLAVRACSTHIRAIMFALYGCGRGELECGVSTHANSICVPVDGNYVLDMMECERSEFIRKLWSATGDRRLPEVSHSMPPQVEAVAEPLRVPLVRGPSDEFDWKS